MPANQGNTDPNWQPKLDFQPEWHISTPDLSYTDFRPDSLNAATEYILNLSIAEIAAYQGHDEEREFAEDLARKIYVKGEKLLPSIMAELDSEAGALPSEGRCLGEVTVSIDEHRVESAVPEHTTGVHVPYILRRASATAGIRPTELLKQSNAAAHTARLAEFLKSDLDLKFNQKAVREAVYAVQKFCPLEDIDILDGLRNAWLTRREIAEANLAREKVELEKVVLAA